jgi:hypothetical protein
MSKCCNTHELIVRAVASQLRQTIAVGSSQTNQKELPQAGASKISTENHIRYLRLAMKVHLGLFKIGIDYHQMNDSVDQTMDEDDDFGLQEQEEFLRQNKVD